MSLTYLIEAARSNKATCKGCKTKIDKDVLRVGKCMPMGDDKTTTQWFHLKCPADETLSCFKGPKATISLADFTSGTDLLSESETELLEAAFTPKRRVSGVNSPAKKQKLTDESPEMADPVFAALYGKYQKKKVADLKVVLKNNRTTMTGTKEELVMRCVDGEKNGALPKCPKCSKKTLKPNDTATAFVCPGNYDDGVYVKCTFSAETVERLPWNDSEVPVAHEEEEEKPKAAEDDAMAAEFAGLEPKAAADKLVELCKDRKLTIPGDESKGRQTVGPVLQATKNPDGSWNPAQALRDLAKAYPKREEMEAAECACPDNVELLANLTELGSYLMKENFYQGNAFKKAIANLQELDYPITSGKKLAKAGTTKVPGVGKGIAEVIDEYLEKGCLAKLQEFRDGMC